MLKKKGINRQRNKHSPVGVSLGGIRMFNYVLHHISLLTIHLPSGSCPQLPQPPWEILLEDPLKGIGICGCPLNWILKDLFQGRLWETKSRLRSQKILVTIKPKSSLLIGTLMVLMSRVLLQFRTFYKTRYNLNDQTYDFPLFIDLNHIKEVYDTLSVFSPLLHIQNKQIALLFQHC